MGRKIYAFFHVRRSAEECGGVRRSAEKCGEVRIVIINIQQIYSVNKDAQKQEYLSEATMF